MRCWTTEFLSWNSKKLDVVMAWSLACVCDMWGWLSKLGHHIFHLGSPISSTSRFNEKMSRQIRTHVVRLNVAPLNFLGYEFDNYDRADDFRIPLVDSPFNRAWLCFVWVTAQLKASDPTHGCQAVPNWCKLHAGNCDFGDGCRVPSF